MILHVVRHAESLANINRSTVVDCELSELGNGQIRAVAAELARVGIDHVYSSPYRRTLLTAQAVAEAANVPFEVYPLLHEHHPLAFAADWPLMTRSELVVNFAGVVLPDDLADRDWHNPPESEAIALERMGRVMADLEARFGTTSKRLVLVTHGSPAGKLLQAFVGASDATRAEIVIANASITTLELRAGKRLVQCVNRVNHLIGASEFPPAEATPQPVTL